MDMTVVCTSGVAVPPPVVTSDPAVVTASVTSEGIDVSAGLSVVAAPGPVLEPPSTPGGGGERVPVVSFRSRRCLSLLICFRW